MRTKHEHLSFSLPDSQDNNKEQYPLQTLAVSKKEELWEVQPLCGTFVDLQPGFLATRKGWQPWAEVPVSVSGVGCLVTSPHALTEQCTTPPHPASAE